MVNYKKMLLAVSLGLSIVKPAFSFDRIVNYSATNCVNAFAADGDIIWVATTGGLYRYNRSNGAGTLYSDPVLFPDPEITTLCIDAHHTLWAGTAKGYLYKRTSQGNQTIINSYHTAGWRISAIDTAGRYLVIGTNNGCSLFDTDKLTVLKNATSFAEGFPTEVTAMAIVRDTLLLGTGGGIVKLFDPAGKSLLDRLAGANFYDRTIWTIDKSHSTAVRSIVVMPDSFSTYAGPAVMFKNRIVYGDSNALNRDGVLQAVLPSALTTLYSNNNRECLIGTAKTYFFIWDGTNTPQAIKIAGPSFSAVTNIQVDREGIAWVSPLVAGNGISVPWEGFSAFANGYWRMYSPVDFPSIGSLAGGGVEMNKGAAEDCLGNMWFGTEGGSVKRYNRANNSWQTYCIYASTDGAGFEPSQNGICGASNWAMSDAITADSTGFLWISCYNNWAGSLICYNPRFEPVPNAQGYENAHYRRFWPKGDPQYSDDYNAIGLLITDAANNIIAGYQKGTIVVSRHNGNPLKDSIRVTNVFNQNTTKVLAAVSTPDSLTRITTAGGIYTFDARNNNFLSGLCAVASPTTDTVIDSTLKEISALAAEDEKILWLGTLNSGLIRYDLTSNTKTVIDETQGLLSNHITGLSIDRKGGYLWVASDRGASRYTIGYQIGIKNAGPPVVYPNPFSKRRHHELVFEKLPPGSTVLLYTVSGSLVASVSPQDASVYGSACVWNPSPSIVPGIYLFAIRSKTKTTQGRIIITP